MTDDELKRELAIAHLAGMLRPMTTTDPAALRAIADEYAEIHLAKYRERKAAIKAAEAAAGQRGTAGTP